MFGMSEYTMMTEGASLLTSYGLFAIALIVLGWITYYVLLLIERKTMRMR
jgi:hypothetical protein